jgi:putative spermidine/putrescine transport system permease protein
MKASLIARRIKTSPWMLLLPALLILGVFFIYPLVGMLAKSFYDPDFTLKHYQMFFNEPAYMQVLWGTFEIAAVVTVGTIVLGYPLAYVLSQSRPTLAGLAMILVIVPYFTSVLVRTYAWMVLLGAEGVINKSMLSIGLIDAPLKIMYTRTGVLIGMIYILLPYMVLSLYSVMKGIDIGLIRASQSLGASRFQAFWKVFFPLSKPGLAAGGLLVFILSIGFFITPALMGSELDSTIPMLIEAQVETYFNWGFASALATILLACTLALFALYEKFVGLNKLFEAKL